MHDSDATHIEYSQVLSIVSDTDREKDQRRLGEKNERVRLTKAG